jgi:hypothetical protein
MPGSSQGSCPQCLRQQPRTYARYAGHRMKGPLGIASLSALAAVLAGCAAPAPVVPSRRVVVVDHASKDSPTPADCELQCAAVMRAGESMRCEGARFVGEVTADRLYIGTVCILTPADAARPSVP